MNIPILYDKNTTNFNTEGLGRLRDTVEDVIVTENTSGFFELEMVYLLDAELSEYIIEGNFIYSNTSERDNDMLKFTIYSVEPDYTEGLLYVNARLTLLDVFMKSVVPEGIYNTTGTHNVLNILKTYIYPTYNFTVTGTDTLKFYLEHEETTVYDIIYGVNGLVEQTGVTLRFYDNGIQVTSTRGNQQPVEITERDFLEQFKIKESRENMVTRIIPYTTLMKDATIKEGDRWTKDTTETKVYGTPVLSPNIAKGYPVITRYVEYRNEITGTRDVTTGGNTVELNLYKYEGIGTLNTEALSFFTDNPNIDEYEITTTIESLGLYENRYGRLESLALYDKADIYIAKHQKLVQTSVTEVAHNVTVGRNTALRFETAKVTIGKVESVLNSGKASQKELSDIVASQNQNIRITNSIINAQGNRINFTTTLPPASESKEGDVTFLEKDDKIELWEFKDGVWVIDMVVSNDQYVKDKIDEAYLEAAAAQAEAESAQTKADQALRDVGISTDLAQTAKDIADTAKTNAQTALNNASAAIGDASEALTASQTALDNAQTALTETGSTKTTVNSLTTRVDEVEGEVELKASQETVDGISGTVSTHTTTLSQHATKIASKAESSLVNTIKGTVDTHTTEISQNATAISARLTSTQVNSLVDGKGLATSTYVNNQISATATGIRTDLTKVEGKIKADIGGRNLILDSTNAIVTNSDHGNYGTATKKEGYISVMPRVNGNVYSISIRTSLDRIQGETYTMSLEVNTLESTHFFWYVSENSVFYDFIPNTNGEWVRVSRTYTQSGETKDGSIGFLWGFASLTAGKELKYRNLKLEKGSVTTYWTPAPEDAMMENDFNVFKNSYQSTIDSINTELSKTAKKTDLNGMVTESVLATKQFVTAGSMTTTLSNYAQKNDVPTNTQFNTLKNSYDSMVQTIGTNGNKIAQMVMTDSAFSTTVRNSFEIGGTNLYPNTTNQWLQQVFTGWQHYFAEIAIGPNNKIQAGDLLTWSAVLNPTKYDVGIMLHFVTNTGGYSQYMSNFIGPNKTGKVSGTTIVPANAISVMLALRHTSVTPVNHPVRYKELKLEKGNKATDWSPAPEDKANQSQVTQLAGSWALTLKSGNDIKTQINASTTSLRLSSKFIHLNGNSLIDNATIKSAHIDSLSASKITTGTLNAANVSIINLDVNTLTGNKSTFITSLFNGTHSSVRITSVGMDALRNDGSIAARFINDGLQIWGDGSWRGSLSYSTKGMVLWAKNNNQLDIGYQGTNTAPNVYSTALTVDGDSGNLTAYKPFKTVSSLEAAGVTTLSGMTTLSGNTYLNGNIMSKINAKNDFDLTGNARFRGDIRVADTGSGIRFRRLSFSGAAGVAIYNTSSEASGIWFGDAGTVYIKSNGTWGTI